jgi:hypothetical protein
MSDSKQLFTIEHNGKVLRTSHFVAISDERCEELRSAYYSKPTVTSLVDNLKKIEGGGSNVSVVTNYYMREVMSLVKLKSPKWSISEVFENNDLIRYFWSRVLASEKVFPPTDTDIRNFEAALRISGGGVAMKPSNFPITAVDSILQRYNLNNRFYDFSCGWGTRMMSAMRNRVDYFGTDPNFHVISSLEHLHADYDSVNMIETNVDLRCIGSEIYQPDWEDTMGLAFSSPPYFSLEDYRIGDQSFTEGVTYAEWLKGYLTATIQNISRYLVSGGFLAINVKDFAGYSICKDSTQIINENSFEYVESVPLKNMTRPSAKQDLNTDEQILIFRRLQK